MRPLRPTEHGHGGNGVAQSIDTMRPFVFVSIPRNASNTVHALFGLDAPRDRSDPAEIGLLDNHATCVALAQRYGAAELAQRYKFCFVRNPWSRCVSWYLYHRALAPYRDVSFREWVLAGMPHHWTVQNETRYTDQRTPLAQHPFICDEQLRSLVDFTGRFERLQDDLERVCAALQVPQAARIPWRNAALACGRESDYRRFYDDATAARVAALLAVDIELFGYAF